MGCGCNSYGDVAPVTGGYFYYPGDCAPEIAAAKLKLANRYKDYNRTTGDCHDEYTARFVARFRTEKGILADITSATGKVDPDMVGVISAEVNVALDGKKTSPWLLALAAVVVVGVIKGKRS